MASPRPSSGQGLTIALFLIGALLLAGGLVFLCAAIQDPARYSIALVLLVLGGSLAAWAGVRWRRARQLEPEILDERITDLASDHDAEVSLARIISELDVPEEAARAAVARLEAAGLCHREQREGRTTYIFPGLKDRKVVRRCAYCGSEYPVREALHKCPNCGGHLEVKKN